MRLLRYGFAGQIYWYLTLCIGILSIHALEDTPMQVLKLYLDGRAVALSPEPRLDNKGSTRIALHAFCRAVGAEAKTLDGGPLAVCKGDLCIPLGPEDTVSTEGTVYARLEAFGEALGLAWTVEGDALRVTSGKGVQTGLGIGQRPPDFALPDLLTGERVSLSDYWGRRAVFYMWASW